ncbi:MAG: class I SAM-dependent methyltransferase [Methylotenera sp.]|uniref:class I SAM-dependent methyltransferase n=1 Tax=Methylotenera sp. TaxID=2051956 RepID=UPI00273070F0|nr:class I SAM-dependent methyltransferase [Methylotenera sp.]MDP1523619.1 class I SAM-dependent methyltransferase [Methylotenera sp.]MDP3817745.1 class I SAM-dependent methyltransferase [Methylotenera sp.]
MLEVTQKDKIDAVTGNFRPLCRFCGHASCDSLGGIAVSDMFAGRITDFPISGGQLWHCSDCDSMFRYPVLSESEYLALYESVNSDIWEDDALRKDQMLIHSAISQVLESGKILDVGCYAGQFLAAFSPSYDKFGVEPSQAAAVRAGDKVSPVKVRSPKASQTAAVRAGDKGIHVLGATINDIAPEMKFDCIVSIDVVEHLLDPVDFFNKAFQLLNPNGFLIISTGNPSSFAWRHIFKSRFWYVTNAEHVSFPSQKFIKNLTHKLGGEVVEVTNFCYADIGLKRSLIKLFGQCTYALSPKLYSAMRGLEGDGSRNPSIYSLGLFKDHHLIVIRKMH